MKLKVYSYVVLQHPKKEKDADTIILKQEPFHLAASQDAAKIDALRCVPDNVDSAQVEVLVRPF
jgi:hypothetical protein